MRAEDVQLLRCPMCGGGLEFSQNGAEPDGSLHCAADGRVFPVVNGIPRFVGGDSYAASFSQQWRLFRQVQLDSHNGTSFSADTFRAITGWNEGDLQGKLVLDAGCGAGRFAEIVLHHYKANLVAFDLSSAVDACQQNLGSRDALICQASIYNPPFPEGAFDFVYSIGVIQHTPDPGASIEALCKLVRPGGQIALWIYELNWKSFIGTAAFRYGLRPITTRLPGSAQLLLCKYLVALFYPLVQTARHAGIPGKAFMRMLPIAGAHLPPRGVSESTLRDWVLLDTLDMYSPAHDRPQRYSDVKRRLEEQGMNTIVRRPHGAIAVTATRSG